MTASPCGVASCPVPAPDPDVLRRLASYVIPAGSRWRRAHKTQFPDPTALVPGVGNTRFAPLPDTRHAYLAQTPVAALLECALHDAVPPVPKIRRAQLALWTESVVELADSLRVIDLRDPQLDRFGIGRDALVSTTPTHYACTRRWAAMLRGRHVGGRVTVGAAWNSRQVEAQAAALTDRPAMRHLVDTHPSDVIVLWLDPDAPSPLLPTGDGLGPLSTGPGKAFVTDLAASLGIPIM
ncbi:MAG: RES domain-containing protein [Euzebya sp.]